MFQYVLNIFGTSTISPNIDLPFFYVEILQNTRTYGHIFEHSIFTYLNISKIEKFENVGKGRAHLFEHFGNDGHREMIKIRVNSSSKPWT